MRFNYKYGAWLLAFTLFALFGWSIFLRWNAVATVQNCLNRDWETTFGPSKGTTLPPALPASLDSAVQKWLNHRYAGNPRAVDYGRDPDFGNYRDNVYHERFRAIFRTSIREIEIIDPRGFRGDLGKALQRFPRLQALTVHDLDDLVAPPEEQWKLFCTRIRSFTELEELDLAGRGITDLALSPLAGHPKLRTIRLRWSSLTPESAKTFLTMPGLKAIYVNTASEVPPEDQARWIKALPDVILNSPENVP